jgi:photosystem II stability/assembly factor-like uncharacterized protein
MGMGGTSATLGSQTLVKLAAGYAAAQQAGTVNTFLTGQSREFVFDASQRVLVNVRAVSASALPRDAQGRPANALGMLQTGLGSLGMVGASVSQAQQLVTGYLPISALSRLPSLAAYNSVTPVYAPHFSAVDTQGDAVIGADTFRATTGVTGSGVTVGVLSDSVNRISALNDGLSGLAESQANGALGGVQVFQDGATGQDEGRAMLEIIHDVAPGAGLAFTTAEGGPQAMAQAMQTLASQGHAGVIVDDAQYPDEPFFNDGVLAQAVDKTAIDYNVAYLTAAGNNANNAWQSAFVPMQTSVGGMFGTFANVSQTVTPSALQHFSLAKGQTLDMSFQWDAAFLEGGSPLPQYEVRNEVDVVVTDAAGQRVLGTFNDNTQNTGEALQRVVFKNDGSFGTNDFALSFRLAAGAAPTTLKWVRFDNNAPAQYQGAPSVFGHANAVDALAVGAVPWNNPKTPEPFTSQGLSTILFDANGNRYGQPVLRYKPDVAGPDGTTTTDFSNFFGTSAAAAHLAGSAALIRAQTPANDYWAAVLAMEQKAIDAGAPGWDGLTGFGLDPTGGPPPAIPLSSSSWTLIGPAPVNGGQVGGGGAVSGRVAGLAADPSNANILYMAAAGGGVWKTTDAGVTWTPLTDGQSTLFMGAIAVAKSNSSVIYAGTGEDTNSGLSFYGRGVLKSTDGGASWTLLTNGGKFDRQTISKIAIDPGDANTVYVAMASSGINGTTGNSGVWKSTDGGSTWTNTTTGISNVTGSNDFSDIIIDPSSTSTLYCAIGDVNGSTANGVYKSTNGGTSWSAAGNFTSLDNGTGLGNIKLAIAASSSSTLYAFASDASSNQDFVGKTTDGGTTWSKVSPSLDIFNGQGFYDVVVAVSPSDANTAFIGGAFNGTDSNGNFTNQVLETTNGGTNWTDITIGADGNGVHPDHHAMTFDANGKLLDGNDGGVWRLDTATTSNIKWTDLNGNLSTLQFIGIGMHPTDQNTVYGGTQDNGTNKFTGALPWKHVQDGDGGFVAVDFTNPNTVYHTFFRVSGSTSFIERSDDGGATWTDISSGVNSNDNSEFYPPYVMDPSNSSRLVLGTDHVYETTDKGATWTAVGTPGTGGFNASGDTVTAVAVAKSAPGTIYVAAGSANIFVTTNDGSSWTQRNIPNISDHIQTLVVDPSNSQVVYAIRDQFGQGKVFKSTDGGASWTDVSGNLPDLPAYGFALDPAHNAWYVGTDNGVFVSTNGGTSWAPFGTGLPNVQARFLQFDPALNVLAAGTHGRSVWEISTVPILGGGAAGDRFEPNDTSDTATNFGGLSGAQSYTGLSILTHASGALDYDWYRWTALTSGTFSAAEKDTAGGDLELHLFTLSGNTLVELAKDVTPGLVTRGVAAAVAAGQTILVEVKGRETSYGVTAQGTYDLSVNLS